MTNIKECNILVCGSQRFTERSFVFKVLTTFFERMPIDNVIISTTSGACEFANDWVKNMNSILAENQLPPIGIKYFDYDPVLEQHSCSIYEGNIPDFVLQNDKFFQDGVKEMLKHNIQAIVAIPNPEGQLGASTLNIKRFCDLSGKKDLFFDCSSLRDVINEYHISLKTDPAELEEDKMGAIVADSVVNVETTPSSNNLVSTDNSVTEQESNQSPTGAFGKLKKLSPR